MTYWTLSIYTHTKTHVVQAVFLSHLILLFIEQIDRIMNTVSGMLTLWWQVGILSPLNALLFYKQLSSERKSCPKLLVLQNCQMCQINSVCMKTAWEIGADLGHQSPECTPPVNKIMANPQCHSLLLMARSQMVYRNNYKVIILINVLSEHIQSDSR